MEIIVEYRSMRRSMLMHRVHANRGCLAVENVEKKRNLIKNVTTFATGVQI